MCCDDLAVQVHGDALTYARALADLESCRRQHRGAALAADGMSLLERIRRLLGHRPSASHALPTPSATLSMTLLWALGVAAVAAHGASSSSSRAELMVAQGPALDVRTMPDTRGLISAVLLGPVGPNAAGPATQQPVVTTSTPGAIAGERVGDANARQAEGRGVIRGRVLRSDTHTPLRKVRISLRAEGRNPLPVPPTATNDDGRFELTGLVAAQYRLFAEKGGFVMTEEDRGPGLDPRDIAGRQVTLRDGERIDRLDLMLVPGGVIAGQVMDETGEPLANAAVHASAQQYHEGRAWPHPSTTAVDVTDDLGRFRLFGLPPGGYFVSAAATSSPSRLLSFSLGSVTGQDVTFYPGTRLATEAVVLHVQPGQQLAGVSFVMVPAPAPAPMAGGSSTGPAKGLAPGIQAQNVPALTRPSHDRVAVDRTGGEE
jgi:hypothetical protein